MSYEQSTRFRLPAPGAARLGASVAICLALVPAGTGWAQETQPAPEEKDDLLAPITDQTDDWRTRTLFTGRDVTLYGQISQAALGYSDGRVREGYAPVDNSNASTRIGLLYDFRPLGGFTAIGRAEIGLTPRPSNSVSLLDRDGNDFELDGSNIRKFEVIIDTPRLGTFTFGQGSMATDGIAEIDLSRTAVTAFSAVDSTAGGQFLRRADGVLSALTIGAVFDNFDGDRVTGHNSDGSRKLRVRYDTRERSGLKLSAAYGIAAGDNQGSQYGDVALRYSWDSEARQFSSGVGYSYKSGTEIVSGSMSVLDKRSGLGLTVAAGRSTAGGRYGYGKISYTKQLFAFGPTAFSLDYYQGSDIALAGSTSRSVGLAAVQQLRVQNLEFFVLARRYSYSEPTTEYLPGRAVFAGLRWAF